MRSARTKICVVNIILSRGLSYLPVALMFILVFSSPLAAQFPAGDDDIDWLIKALKLEEGSVVADVGAGDGDQTLEIAKHIGPEGKIFSTELESELSNLREAVEQSDLENVIILEGDPNQTNLPEQCCDAIFLRRVYHHFDDPKSMNISLWQSLQPGGRLAIIDFQPRESEANPEDRDQGGHHGVTVETVVKEMKEVGFSLVSSDEQESGRSIYVVMEKPEEEDG